MRSCAWFLSVLTIAVSFPAIISADGIPPIPARIGGTISIDGTPISQGDIGVLVVTVTRVDGATFTPPAVNEDGLNGSDWYLVDIPIFDADSQPGGAVEGETGRVKVFAEGIELEVVEPGEGLFEVGTSGSTNQVNLVCVADNQMTPVDVPLLGKRGTLVLILLVLACGLVALKREV